MTWSLRRALGPAAQGLVKTCPSGISWSGCVLRQAATRVSTPPARVSGESADYGRVRRFRGAIRSLIETPLPILRRPGSVPGAARRARSMPTSAGRGPILQRRSFLRGNPRRSLGCTHTRINVLSSQAPRGQLLAGPRATRGYTLRCTRRSARTQSGALSCLGPSVNPLVWIGSASLWEARRAISTPHGRYHHTEIVEYR
jgi:hypothetical protein